MIKRLIVAIVLSACQLMAVALTHTVARGENLQGIAQRYGITTEQLLSANPKAETLFYVGMKLEIPEQSPASTHVESGTETINRVQNQPTDMRRSEPIIMEPTSDENNSAADSAKSDKPGVSGTFDLRYGFGKKAKNMKGHSFNFQMMLGGNYYVMKAQDGLFVGAGVGWRMASSNFKSDYDRFESSYHYIMLSPRLGYAIAMDKNPEKLALIPYAAVNIGFCVSAKQKFNKEEKKAEKRTGYEAEFGLKLRISGFDIGAAYSIPFGNKKEIEGMKDDSDDGYFSVSLGFGF